MPSGLGAEYPGIKGWAQKCHSIILTMLACNSKGQKVHWWYLSLPLSLCLSPDLDRVLPFVFGGGTVIVNLGVWLTTGTFLLPPPIILMESTSGGRDCERLGNQMKSELGPWVIGMPSRSTETFDLPGMPPSHSFASALPVGWNPVLMNLNSPCACSMLYGVIESLASWRRVLTALRRCHQHSWIFACDQVFRHNPISAISFSTCTNCGTTPYLSWSTVPQVVRALVLLPISVAATVESRQYDNGKLALSYSPRTV